MNRDASHTFAPRKVPTWSEVWVRTTLTGVALLVSIFVVYELMERSWLLQASPATLHAAHIARGVGAALLLASWAFVSIWRARARCDAVLEDNVRVLEAMVHERTRELFESRAFTELLFDSLRERIVVTDQEGRVVKANRVAQETAESTMVGRLCSAVNPACGNAGPCLAIAAFRGEIATNTVRADAQGRLWEIETIPVCDAGGRTHLVIEVGRDVTKQKSLEAQVRHQEKMVALGLLAAGFAHDLGNPLASLTSELELLEEEHDEERLRASLAVLRRHVHRINRTLREMVDFSRRRRDEISDVSVAVAVDDSLRLVRHDTRWKQVQVEVNFEAALPAVHMVEDHLVLVMLNLLLNAADAMPRGGCLTIAARHIEASVELRVRDTGHGMPREVLENATKPLFTTKPAPRGTGLGLSVCVDIVQSVGGNLTIESAPGKGTEVRILLPCASVAPSVSHLPVIHG